MKRKIICILVIRPHIRQFIHYEDSVFIARIQHRLAHRMMRTSDTVESGFFHLTAASLFRFLQRCGANDSVVVMDAGSAQFYLLSVDAESMLRIQFQFADTKRLMYFVKFFLSCINIHYTFI